MSLPTLLAKIAKLWPLPPVFPLLLVSFNSFHLTFPVVDECANSNNLEKEDLVNNEKDKCKSRITELTDLLSKNCEDKQKEEVQQVRKEEQQNCKVALQEEQKKSEEEKNRQLLEWKSERLKQEAASLLKQTQNSSSTQLKNEQQGQVHQVKNDDTQQSLVQVQNQQEQVDTALQEQQKRVQVDAVRTKVNDSHVQVEQVPQQQEKKLETSLQKTLVQPQQQKADQEPQSKPTEQQQDLPGQSSSQQIAQQQLDTPSPTLLDHQKTKLKEWLSQREQGDDNSQVQLRQPRVAVNEPLAPQDKDEKEVKDEEKTQPKFKEQQQQLDNSVNADAQANSREKFLSGGNQEAAIQRNDEQLLSETEERQPKLKNEASRELPECE